jgi:hypothetical protein
MQNCALQTLSHCQWFLNCIHDNTILDNASIQTKSDFLLMTILIHKTAEFRAQRTPFNTANCTMWSENRHLVCSVIQKNSWSHISFNNCNKKSLLRYCDTVCCPTKEQWKRPLVLTDVYTAQVHLQNSGRVSSSPNNFQRTLASHHPHLMSFDFYLWHLLMSCVWKQSKNNQISWITLKKLHLVWWCRIR